MKLSVSQLCDMYHQHALVYYRKRISKRQTGEANNVRDSHRALLTLFADMAVDDLRVSHLRRLQTYLASGIDPQGEAPDLEPVARRTVNNRINRIRRMIRWAAEHEHVDDVLPHRLSTLSALKPGRTSARETPPVPPVPEVQVWATLGAIQSDMAKRQSPEQRRTLERLAVMIELHWHLGCRPGELVIMRKSGIDSSGPVWLYTPAEHKTDYHGHDRRIAIGPRAQKVLVPWYVKTTTDALFADCEGNPITRANYAQSILRTNRRHGLTHWTPNRIRHSAATRFRAESGSLDAVQAILGHKNANVTQVYAERNDAKAIELAQACG